MISPLDRRVWHQLAQFDKFNVRWVIQICILTDSRPLGSDSDRSSVAVTKQYTVSLFPRLLVGLRRQPIIPLMSGRGVSDLAGSPDMKRINWWPFGTGERAA